MVSLSQISSFEPPFSLLLVSIFFSATHYLKATIYSFLETICISLANILSNISFELTSFSIWAFIL